MMLLNRREEITMALQLRPNCEYCDKDLPRMQRKRGSFYECTFCADCADNKLHNVCPNCGGGFVPRPIRPAREWRPGLTVGNGRRQTSAFICLQPRRYRSAFGADQERSTAGSLTRRRDRALDLTEPDAIAVALAQPRITSESPSSRNVRLTPPGSSSGSVPFQLISSRLPR